MKIIVNHKPLEISGKRLLIEELRDAGYDIPSLCHADEAKHTPSCMLCMVKNVTSGAMIPSCGTMPVEGMELDVDSDEVLRMRRLSLELLLSDHRADCEAPCTWVCPKGMDPARIIYMYDNGRRGEAKSLIPSTEAPCDGCKAPCEKVCRRGTVDTAVHIREIIRGLSSDDSVTLEPLSEKLIDKTAFNSRIGRFTDKEKTWLQEHYDQSSRCLHCACEGQAKCRLRQLAGKAGIKNPRYGISSAMPVKQQIPVNGKLFFEPAKCIRCGLCVYNSEDGFTFQGRGFGMQVTVPEQSRPRISERLAKLCPTGALFLKTLLLVLVFVVSACHSFQAEKGNADWTIFRGKPSLSGFVNRELPRKPELLWEYRHGTRTVSSPIVYGSTVYICDRKGKMEGISLQGEKIYERDLQTTVEASFLIRDSMLYIGQIDGEIKALSLKGSDDPCWTFASEGQISASPNLVTIGGKGKLLVGSYDGTMYILDPDTGECSRRFLTGYYINGAAACQGEYAVFGGCDAWLRILDCRTGIQTDSLELDAYIPSSPVICGDYVYVADYQGNVNEVMLNDGKIKYRRKLMTAEEGSSMLAMPAVSRDAVYVLSDNRYLCRLNRNDGNLVWKQILKGETGESSPLVCGNRVLVCTKTGLVSIHDARTGASLWEYETGEQIISSPAVLNDRFIILTAKGTLLCFGEK